MERYLPGFVESMFTSPPDKVSELWRTLLINVFQPLTLETQARRPKQAELSGNGAHLREAKMAGADQERKRIMHTRIAELDETLGPFCLIMPSPRFCLHAKIPLPTKSLQTKV